MTATFKRAPRAAPILVGMTTYDDLKPHVEQDLSRAREARRRSDRDAAWKALERAHVLSQPSAWLHIRVHVRMFADAFHDMDLHEIAGQAVRILAAPIGSWLGRYPLGNTGRARVPIFQPMPLAPDVAAVFDQLAIAHRPPIASAGGRR